ncbi:uncharacterized protein BP01DRAFT_390653 [Aspergillus saccharolyticus JOP 1030-1]|uniref:SigF-like NTF2-like domain-containing protein n=1 Tax=Aspergillus saccharolyticus JOP 1030-1 TaxID=1450539 RepID=A0A318ZHF7_9EURO|nr:hypothetical protein BP01DRAFT_390653 [Aspergillus saccharolyticus JOP 1030-1]PYH47001.1 hypothetical protein BP01DRAFT_390653 [Aspergillus saccharolyticus JOP 1030-1]
MEDPTSEITTIIHHLTQGSPQDQERTIQKFFTPSASFVHPFCRVWSSPGSRWFIEKIYQWYKIMSPRIEMEVQSVAYDKPSQKLYLTMSQIFSIWLVPFHVAPVTLTTVLSLTTDPEDGRTPLQGSGKRYYIKKQEDFYQPSEFIKFVLPWGIGQLLVLAAQTWATLFCIVGCAVFWPLVWLEEKGVVPGRVLRKGNLGGDVVGWEKRRFLGVNGCDEDQDQEQRGKNGGEGKKVE